MTPRILIADDDRASLRPLIRWVVRRDLPQVLDMMHGERDPWTEDDILRTLRQRECIGLVAERGDNVLGFLIYELREHHLEVLAFVVAPAFRRKGIGSQMARKLATKLARHGRSYLGVTVRETNLTAQLFFRCCGWKATRVYRRRFKDTQEDAYRMTYGL